VSIIYNQGTSACCITCAETIGPDVTQTWKLVVKDEIGVTIIVRFLLLLKLVAQVAKYLRYFQLLSSYWKSVSKASPHKQLSW